MSRWSPLSTLLLVASGLACSGGAPVTQDAQPTRAEAPAPAPAPTPAPSRPSPADDIAVVAIEGGFELIHTADPEDRRRVIGPVSEVSVCRVDPRAQVVWFVQVGDRGSSLWALDLEGDELVELLAPSMALYDFVVDHGDAGLLYGSYDGCEFLAALRVSGDASVSARRAIGGVHPRFCEGRPMTALADSIRALRPRERDWLREIARRRDRPLRVEAERGPRVTLEPSRCVSPALCGVAWEVPGAPYSLVRVAAELLPADGELTPPLFRERYAFFDRARGEFRSLADPARRSKDPAALAEAPYDVAFSPSGDAYAWSLYVRSFTRGLVWDGEARGGELCGFVGGGYRHLPPPGGPPIDSR